MQNNTINTIPIQQFIQQVKAAELSQQREIKLDIKIAKNLALCLAEISAKLLQDYSELLNSVSKTSDETVTIKMDGGSFNQN
jgi:hypothetical protein